MAIQHPASRPENPRFSSGPCAKPPTFNVSKLADAPLGRSHRASVGKARLKAAIDGTRQILGIPDNYRVGIVPASDTGAVEMAMWSLLGVYIIIYIYIYTYGEKKNLTRPKKGLNRV